MANALSGLNPVIQALLATTFTWFMTALGAAPVFLTERFSRKVMDGLLGFAAGVMIAASYWSLLAPAIELPGGGLLPAAIGFLTGGAFIYIIDRILPHLHLFACAEETEGIRTAWRRSVLVVLAITLHNIPEGLAIGVTFGAAALGSEKATLGAAIALTLGLGLQNLPEGLAVAMPLRREGMGQLKAFLYGQASGLVEPLGGVIGAALVLLMQQLLPYGLGFAAGAMIFVVVEELIPESQCGKHAHIATLGTMLGFVIMMVLDVALG
jgi:ZIP family zinc transporter